MKGIVSLAFYIVSLCFCLAQSQPKQMLVFRSSGEVNLFYTSELDSIVTSGYDAGNVFHEETVFQRFYTPDTCLVIPVAEIDSVAVGSRNMVEAKPGVRFLTAADSAWITGYSGTQITYSLSTPGDILPKVGEKLFYGKTDRLFPIGLIAEVTDLNRQANGYIADVKDVEFSDVFSRLFYADSIGAQDALRQQVKAQGAPPYSEIISQQVDLDLPLADNFNIRGIDKFRIAGKVVANPLADYYHIEGQIYNNFDFQITGRSDDSGILEVERDLITVPLGVYALVFMPSFSLGGFASFEGEMSSNLRLQRNTGTQFNFTRNKGVVEDLSLSQPSGTNGETSSQLDLTLRGELMAGAQGALSLNILRKLDIAKLRLRAGISLSGELGLGLLTSLRDYAPEAYGKAILNSAIKFRLEALGYTRNPLAWGEEQEHLLSRLDYTIAQKSFDLFPRYFQSKAVAVRSAKSPAVSSATKTDNDILHSVETGFELVDGGGKVVDSVFVDTVRVKTDKVQGFAAELPVAADFDFGSNLLRPVFRYAGHTIAGPAVSISDGAHFQPFVFTMTNGPVNMVSGIPFSGEARNDSTLFIAGPYLPIPVPDSVFADSGIDLVPGNYIGSSQKELFIGTWTGRDADGNEVAYTFREDLTASVQRASENFSATYCINEPQTGDIAIDLDNGNESIVFTVIELGTAQMRVRYKNHNQPITLNKQPL